MRILRCRILVLAVMLLAVCGEAGAYTYSESEVPDRIFREYLQGEYYYNDYSNYPSYIKQILVSEQSIYSLKGVELFTNLQVLNCSNNRITELDLSSNTQLQILYCNSNMLKTLDLSKLTKLEELACDFTIGTSGENRTFNFTAFKRAYSLDVELNDNSTVTVMEGPSGTTTSYKLSDIKDISSGEYIMRFAKKADPFESIQFQPYGTALSSVTVYPASASSSSPTTPTIPTNTDVAPAITTTELDPATVGKAYSFQLLASAGATWTVKGKFPDGLSMSSTGLITGTPTKQGSKKITFTAANDKGDDKKKLTLTVYELPEITTESLKNATVGKKYKETIKGKGSKPLTWTFEATLPDGLTLNTSKQKISGKPTINTAGTVTATLSNPVGTVTKTFTFSADAILPEIKTKKLKDGTYGKPYKAVIKTKGTEPITLRLRWPLPEGLTFNKSTGEISGTPTEAVYDDPTKIIAENMGGSVDKEFSLTIKAVPPKITTKKLPDAVYDQGSYPGKYYSAEVDATGTPPITFEAEGLPDGLSMNTSGKISGYVYEYGKFSVKVSATNLAKTVKKNLKLNVLSTPWINDDSYLPSGTVGKSYKYKFNVTGTKPITFKVAHGQLPNGITLDAKSGKLSGKPTTAGTFEFQIDAVNSVGSSGADFGITITDKNGNIPSETPAATSSEQSANGEDSEIPETAQESENAPVIDEDSAEFSAGESYDVVAVLPEVSVDVSGTYDFSVELGGNAQEGDLLVWLANSDAPSDDDSIAEFFDEDGREIDCVPESRKISVSVWLNAGKVYKPAIAVRR